MMAHAVSWLPTIRSLFPHTRQGRIYLNHAGTSPLSTRVVSAMTRYLLERSEGKIETYWDDLPMVNHLRQMIQVLINAESPDRIALTANTSDAINIVAAGIDWRAGDQILVARAEFPANVWPYLNLRRRGVEVVLLEAPDAGVTADMVAGRLTSRSRLVALSAVQYLSGYRADLAAIGSICRDRGVVFAVDGIQAVGAVRLDVQNMSIDALAAGGQKWQMSPHGTGFLYLTEALQDRLQQASLGWLAVRDPWDFANFGQPVASSARRYEGGSLIMPSLWGMHAAIGTILEIGPAEVESQILSLAAELFEGLSRVKGISVATPPSPQERAGIVTIKLPPDRDPKLVLKQLRERNITPALREGMIRFSPHCYCSAEEMHQTVEATKEALRP